MNELQIFNSGEFGDIRTITIDNEPWFVGIDVAKSLGYANPKNAVPKHFSDSMGRPQETTIINESGLYSLIFGSKLESAKRFKRWVTSEVLPTIRKTGSYKPMTIAEQIQLLVFRIC